MVQKAEPRPRGRPRAYDPEAALGKARDMFWQAGYAGTSLDELSAATGMNRPSLYAAFGDKRSLYLTTLERQKDATLASAEAALAGPGSLRAVMQTTYAMAIDAYLTGEQGARGCFLIGTALTEAVGEQAVREILHEIIHGLDAVIQARLERARVEGELPADADVSALAYLASAAVHGLAMRARAGEPREALERWAAGTVAVICRGAP